MSLPLRMPFMVKPTNQEPIPHLCLHQAPVLKATISPALVTSEPSTECLGQTLCPSTHGVDSDQPVLYPLTLPHLFLPSEITMKAPSHIFSVLFYLSYPDASPSGPRWHVVPLVCRGLRVQKKSSFMTDSCLFFLSDMTKTNPQVSLKELSRMEFRCRARNLVNQKHKHGNKRVLK